MKQPTGGSFKKGKSGNPAGRPKVALEFQARAREVVDELVLDAWEAEVRNMGDDWLRASELLAAYGYGKPPQAVEFKDVTPNVLSAATLADLLDLARSGK